MRGCLFVLVLGALVVALGVGIGLPAVADGVLTAGVSAAGLRASDTTVTVTSDPPTDLLGLHADRVRIRATQATFRGLSIAALDVTLLDVALAGRTVGAIDGRLDGVAITNIGARPMPLGTVTLSGGGDTVVATASIPGSAVRTLLADDLELEVGIRPTAVTLAPPDGVAVRVGTTANGRLAVTSSGDLVIRVLDGVAAGREIVLLRGGEDLPIRLTGVTVMPDGGLRLVGVLSVPLLG